MKCKNCNGDLVYENGILTCQSCGSSFSSNDYFEDIEVYLCYLETDEMGRRTKDSAIAQEIYNILEEKKVKTFYKRISTGDFAGETAQTIDEIALQNSKAVLLIATSKENYSVLWEKNSDRLRNKKIIPVYAVMNANDIPKEINAIQALKYDSVGASADLIKGILKVLGRQSESEQNYETLNKKQTKKKSIVLVIVFALIIGLVIVGFTIWKSNKTVDDSQEEIVVEADEDTLYNDAVAHIDNEEYADAIEILYKLGDYKDSESLLNTCYAKYAGYYYDENSGIYFQLQSYDGKGSVEITSTAKKGETCTVNETISFKDRACDFSFTDSEGNHGECSIMINNDAVQLVINTSEQKGDFTIPDSDITFSISDKADQPIRKALSLEDLESLISEEKTIGDLKRDGYEVSFVESLGIEMGSDSLYKVDNTDIYLTAFQKPDEGDEYVDSETSNDDDNHFIYVIKAPISIIKPELIGNDDDPFTEDGFVFYPNGSFSPEYGGLMCDIDGSVKEITEDTMVVFKQMTDSDKELYEQDIAKRKGGIQETDFDMNRIQSFSATSTLVWNGIEYPPSQIADGSLELAWQEGVEGCGEGESVSIYFDKKYKINGMIIYGGYQKSEKLYGENSRPKDIMISFDDGTVLQSTLSDVCDGQTITFDNPVEAGGVTIIILSVYEGSTYEDTSISEVKFF